MRKDREKKIVPVVITYPFSGNEIAWVCRCGKTLRRSNLHSGRIYVVSELDHNEIRSTRPHLCAKDKSKKTEKNK
jgi:hypothetical protein